MLGSTQIGAEQMTVLARTSAPTTPALPRRHPRLCRPPHARGRRRTSGRRLRGAEMTDNDCFTGAGGLDPRHHNEVGRFRLRVDYTGTDPQMKGFKNSSISNTRSATYVALTSFLDPEIPRNAGTYRCVTVKRRLAASSIRARRRPMTMCTVLPAHEIIHACWMALAKAEPDAPAPAGARSPIATWPDPRRRHDVRHVPLGRSARPPAPSRP